MARTIPSDYEAIPVDIFSYDRPIREGASTKKGEQDLILNQNYLHSALVPTFVSNPFMTDDAGGACYLVGAATTYGNCRAVWRRKFFVDLDRYHFTVLAENTGGGTSGKVKFELASDSTNVEIDIPITSTQWTVHTGTLVVNQGASGGRDTIEMYIKNGNAGAVRVHWIGIRHDALSTIAAGKSTAGFVPFDDVYDVAQDRPLSTHVRQAQFDNFDILRKTRADTVIGWAEDGTRAASTYESDSNTKTLVALIPFSTSFGQTELEWACYAYHNGASGTLHIESQKTGDSQAITLGTTWSSPYSAALTEDTDGGQDTITVLENTNDVLLVYLTADNPNKAFLMSLVVWFEDVT